VADACKCGKQPSGSIKFGEFLNTLKNLLASEETFCSLELVNYVL